MKSKYQNDYNISKQVFNCALKYSPRINLLVKMNLHQLYINSTEGIFLSKYR